MKKTKLALTLTSSALLASGTADAAVGRPAAAVPTNARPAKVQAAKLAAMNKEDIKKLLAKIEQAKAPAPKIGAMCYMVAISPERLDYVCPKCGQKTLHPKEVSWEWTHELDSCRRLFKEVPKREAMELDESSFCRKCQPNAVKSSLTLRIRYSDGTTNVVAKVTSDDLRLLKGLLGGSSAFATANDGTSDLKSNLPRLRELLGIKP